MQKIIERIDEKGIAIAKQLLNLRHSIDVHRIIGLNAGKMREANISGRLFGHYQKLSHESIAIGFCKIYEFSIRNELDSIPAAIRQIDRLPDQLDDDTIDRLRNFGKKYGIDSIPIPTNAGSLIREVFTAFKEVHEMDLSRLKEFRDKIGAHRESGVQIDTLPSHYTYECLFEFAYDFYCLTAREFVNCGPAPIYPDTGHDLIDTLKALGVEDPDFDFND